MNGFKRNWLIAWVVPAIFVACSTAAPAGTSGTGATATPGAPAPGWTPSVVDGKLQPLPDGFPNEDIRIIVADNPTSADAILIQTLATAASKYSPVNVQMEAREDFEAFGSWEAMRYIHDTEGGSEGYILHILGSPGGIVDLHAVDIQKELGLGLDDLDEVISLETRPYYVVERNDVPWDGGWEGFIEYAKANPGEVRVMGGGPGTNTDLVLAFYLLHEEAGNLYEKADFNHINVGGIAERVLAVAAGEGEITVSTVDAAQPHFQSGRLELILISGDREVEEFPDVPNARDIGVESADDPAIGSTKQIVAAATVDDQHIQWLWELLRMATADEEYVSTRSAIPASEPLIRTPEESDALNHTTFERMEEVTKFLGIHHTQTEE